MELSETRVRALIRLIKRGRRKVDDIKDENYKEEVESRLNNEE